MMIRYHNLPVNEMEIYSEFLQVIEHAALSFHLLEANYTCLSLIQALSDINRGGL